MNEAATKETLKRGSYLGMMSVLIQLRKVCNHPDLFEGRPILSPMDMSGLCYNTSSAAFRALESAPFDQGLS